MAQQRRPFSALNDGLIVIAGSFTDKTIAASGGTGSKTYTNDQGVILEVVAIMGKAEVGVAGNSAIPLYGDGDPKAANNDQPARGMLQVYFEGTKGGPWVSDKGGVAYSSIVGTAQKPFYLPDDARFRIAPSETVKTTLTNNSGTAIKDEISLLCRKVRTAQAA